MMLLSLLAGTLSLFPTSSNYDRPTHHSKSLPSGKGIQADSPYLTRANRFLAIDRKHSTPDPKRGTIELQGLLQKRLF